ncbi:class I SAM-dependent methyltransferase [Campylobacter sp. CNRCH_2016_0050h]|uniref:class I SAM-dependent methyltransferase n=1 Tax=Campylobacter sp. CNRCH_2016_0050h TaxID=2911608 RepID=UPI0021E67688|nr:class I SAM-dependent methyltransferase [Campylobacter sp. CNRCH_2016_0050h]MCV3456608.1 class I SAM-dependent methyltransferase [Campylobacter sp. CNRCH_2016_0050h]
MSIYDEEFYKQQSQGSYQSAKEIIPIINNFIPNIQSVLDVGCGIGTWLKAWQEQNKLIEIFGVDGNDISESFFYIDKHNYKKVDLTTTANTILDDIKQSLKDINKNYSKLFNLTQSLEVAEHIDEKYAQNFIELLTLTSDIILFSAAIPNQGGLEHINEQPPKYWANLFEKYDYLCFDIRNLFWENDKIDFWYRQNIFLYIHKDKINSLELPIKSTQNPMHMVHPEKLIGLLEAKKEKENEKNKGFRLYLRHPKKIFQGKK